MDKLRQERDELAADVHDVVKVGQQILADLADRGSAPISIEHRHVRTRQRSVPKRKISEEGKRRIAAAAKKRWAKYRKDKAKAERRS